MMVPDVAPAAPDCRRPLLVLGLLAALAALLLDARPLAAPGLVLDDFQIVAGSWTWQKTWAGLWEAHNEHAMPLGRLLTFALDWLAGRPSALPRACSLVGPAALLAGLPLVYLFVRRETGQAGVGLAAVILFGVSSVYSQAVFWFAASFALLSVDTLLLALLACQRWRQTGRLAALAAALLLAALSPGWFALGVLAGPLCALYLLASWRQSPGVRSPAARAAAVAAPLAGTALFLAVSLPRNLDRLDHLPHHEGRTMRQVIDPLGGLAYSGRAVVDGLLLGTVGVTAVALPVAAVVLILPLLAAVGVWWGRRARAPVLLWLGLGMIAAGYLLVYSARTYWPYKTLTEPIYNRYHLLPHLGLVLFVCGGLPGRWCFRDGADVPVRVLAWLLGACLLVQLPRGLLCSHAGIPSGTALERLREGSSLGRTLLAPLTEEQLRALDSVAEQQAALRHIEEVDALCRRHHLSADDARAALPPLDIPDSNGSINGWELLRGSASPRPRPPDEVRRLLEAPP